MRICKVGILLFLILKASLGFGMAFTIIEESCCSHETASIEVVSHNYEDSTVPQKNCCDGPACHCYCCHAVFIGDDLKEWQLYIAQLNNSLDIDYTENYQFTLTDAIWQPPRL